MTAAAENTGIAISRAAPAQLKKRDIAFFLLLASLPFQGTALMQARIGDIPGLKIPYVLIAMSVFAFLQSAGTKSVASKSDSTFILAYCGYVGLFLIAFIRSIYNLPVFHAVFPTLFGTSVVDYFDFSFLMPLLLSASFVYVIRMMKTWQDIRSCLSAIGFGIFLLSIAIIVMIANDPAIIADTDRLFLGDKFDQTFGMHYNDLATVYTVAGPFILYFAIKKGGFWGLNYLLALVAIVLLKSRTGIVCFAISSVALLMLSGRIRILLTGVPIAIAAALLVSGSILINLLALGFRSGGGISLFFLLSGREQKIWLPLAYEWWNDPARFWFGAGHFGILNSSMLRLGAVLPVAHAHNAFLTFFLDNGIVMVVVLLIVIGALLSRAVAVGRQIRDPLYWSLLLGIVAFLVACFTGRHFSPAPDNYLLFPLMGCMINIARLKMAVTPTVPIKETGVRLSSG